MSGGPFQKPLFGAPAVAPIGDNANVSDEKSNEKDVPTQPVRRFNLKQSALSSVADDIWKKSQSVFHVDQKIAPVHLEKKTLNDVLGKISAEGKEKSEEQEAPKFIFGSKIKDKVSGDIPVEKPQENQKETPSAPKSSLLDEVTTESTSKFREESTHVVEALKKEQEKQLAGTSLVEVTTGEEDDKNIIQAACKLHIFDKEKKTWAERGLCQFRINMRRETDAQTHYRIVARSVGNQRVIINSKIFSDMFLERVDTKRLKLSAMCPESTAPQIFLLTISFSKTDLTMDALYASLQDCLKKERTTDEKRKRKAPNAEDSASQEHSDPTLSKREKTESDENKEETNDEPSSGKGDENTNQHNGGGDAKHKIEEVKGKAEEDTSEQTKEGSQDSSR